MTIRKGEPWGVARPLPPDAHEVATDQALRQLVLAARDQGRPVPPIALVGGDLSRTMGGSGDRRGFRAQEALAFPVDLGLARLDDGAEQPFVAHAVARRRGWSGRFAVAMNAAWLGTWYLGPRAHPNDGLLDLTQGSLPLVQRVLARRRAPTGSHLPHPALVTRRSAEHAITFDRPTAVRLDGAVAGRARRLELRCEPDSFWCWV